MIRITDGVHQFTVSEGAFDNVFKQQGYQVLEPATPADSIESEPEKQADPLDEKPVSKWTKQELKSYCDKHGIDLEGVTSSDEVRKRVLSYQEQGEE